MIAASSAFRLLISSILAGGILTAGCATTGEGSLPPVSRPQDAAQVTIHRDGSLVGLFADIRASLDGHELRNLGRNESYTFALDPGQYLLDYRIGLNSCRRVLLIEPRQVYRLRLAPNCSVFGALE